MVEDAFFPSTPFWLWQELSETLSQLSMTLGNVSTVTRHGNMKAKNVGIWPLHKYIFSHAYSGTNWGL